MSIASECPDCCACLEPVYAQVPSVVAVCVSKTATPTLCGFSPLNLADLPVDSPDRCRRWKTSTVSGELLSACCDGAAGIPFPRGFKYAGSATYDCGAGTLSEGRTRAALDVFTCEDPIAWATPVDFPTAFFAAPDGGDPQANSNFNETKTAISYEITGPGICSDASSQIRTGTASEVLSNEDTIADAIARATPTEGTSCCAETGTCYGGSYGESTSVTVLLTVNGAPSTTYSLRIRYSNTCGETASDDTFETIDVETDEEGIADIEVTVPDPAPGCTRCFEEVQSDLYTFRFSVPTVGLKNCYRIDWVERTVPDGGVALDTIEVVTPGVYRPTVSYSAPPTGGIRAQAVVEMTTAGAIASVHLLNPGWGYTSPPTFTVEPAILGGTSSTGWTTSIDSNGRVTSTSGGTAGNYLPTIAISGAATATCEMNSYGGISSITVTAGGSGYVAGPSITVVPKTDSAVAAYVLPHFGTEVARSWQWAEGDIPAGYDPLDSSTWPSAGEGGRPYITLGSTDATVSNVHAFCANCEDTSNIIPTL